MRRLVRQGSEWEVGVGGRTLTVKRPVYVTMKAEGPFGDTQLPHISCLETHP